VIRVIVADDHPVFRAGLRRTLEDAGDMTVVGEASSGDEVLQTLRKTPVDVLVLDVLMPGMGFLEVVRRIRTGYPQLPVLVVSMQPEEQCAVRAFRAGAAGYLAKDRSSDQLVGAVRLVAEGRKFFSPELAERLVEGLSASSARLPHETLSDREYEVLCLIGSGKAVKEIAFQLSLSPKTVGTYRARLMQKMKVRSSAELVRYAVQQGLSV
jgi:DNA-binding NarL/FixJ family response regulator